VSFEYFVYKYKYVLERKVFEHPIAGGREVFHGKISSSKKARLWVETADKY
jgi:hypothetical protein